MAQLVLRSQIVICQEKYRHWIMKVIYIGQKGYISINPTAFVSVTKFQSQIN